jgi:hypothetical protein
MSRRRALPVILLFLILIVGVAPPAAAQSARPRPRIGIGFNAMLSSSEGLGIGIRTRAAYPINADLSFAVGGGITGFVLEGRDQATYILDPQASVIVTLDQRGDRTPYFLGGVGAVIPVNNRSRTEGGPTIHFGIGWVQGLRDTVLFYEVDPMLLVGESEISFMVPFRVGVIF